MKRKASIRNVMK